MQNIKPTFGVVQKTSNNDSRPELGAIWTRTSKSNTEFMSIKVNLTKTKLQELLNNSTTEEVQLNLVAFPNKQYEENSKRPNYRVYEERKND